MSKKLSRLALTMGLLAVFLVPLFGQTALSDGGAKPGPVAADLDQAFALGDRILEAPGTDVAWEDINPGFTVDILLDSVWGLVEAGDHVRVSRPADGAYGAAEADATGFFWTPVWLDTGRPADLEGGDVIEVYVNDALQATMPLLDVSGGIDLLADEVDGVISGDGGGTQVTVTSLLGGATSGELLDEGSPQATTTTGGGGAFTAAFGADLGPENYVAVEYPSGGHTVRTYLYPEPRAFYVANLSAANGSADPGQEVHVTVYEGSGPGVRFTGTGDAGEPHGFYSVQIADAQPGDLVEVDLGGGTILETTIAALSITNVDTLLDQFEGTAPAGADIVVRMWPEGGYVETVTVADGAGDFLADLSGVADLLPRNTFRVAVVDGDGNESQLISGAPFLRIRMDPLSEIDCAEWRVDGPNLPVTLTIETASGVFTRENTPTSDAGNGGGPYCYLIWGPEWGPIDFSPGDTFTIASPTWQASLVLADVTWSVDSEADTVSGDAPPGDVQVLVQQWNWDQYPIRGAAMESTTASSSYEVTFAGFDVRDGGSLQVLHHHGATDFATWYTSWNTIRYQGFTAILDQGVEGVPPSPGEPVSATLFAADGTELASTDSDDDDDPWWFYLNFGPGFPVEPGQRVAVASESGWEADIEVPELTVNADPGTGLVWGVGPKSLVSVQYDWFNGEYWEPRRRFVPVDDYVLDATYFGESIGWGQEVFTAYQAPNGNTARARLTWPWMYVNYWEDSAGGAYEVGHTFDIEVTGPGGITKATATVGTEPGGGGPDGNWENGFTVQSGDWSPANPDIRPGDEVHFSSDDGYTASVRVGTIRGAFNPDSERVSGSLDVPWLASETVEVGAGGWGWPGFQNDEVDLDSGGLGRFSMNFWPEDLTPETVIGVWYEEPDSNRVYSALEAGWQVYLPLVILDHTP